MIRFKILVYLALTFTILSCEQRNTKILDAQTALKQADSLLRDPDTVRYKTNLLRASSILKQASSHEPNNIAIRQFQIRTYTFMRAPDSVLLIYHNWLKKEPLSLEANLYRGLLYHVLKKEDKAQANFETVKKILSRRMLAINDETSDKDLNILLNMSFNFFLIGEKEIAYKIISDIYKIHPNHPRAKNAFLKFNTFNREIEISKRIGF